MSDTQTVVLVEGVSDKSAVDALAERRGRNLAAEGISLVAMGGATNIGTYLARFGPPVAISAWPVCATSGRKATSGGVSSAPAMDPISAEAIWRRSDSSCASPTWKTN